MIHRLLAPTVALMITAFGSTGAYAAAAPCEDALRQLREKEAASSVSDANKAAYEDAKAKGIERCNADDDKRADAFFAQAMDLLGK